MLEIYEGGRLFVVVYISRVSKDRGVDSLLLFLLYVICGWCRRGFFFFMILRGVLRLEEYIEVMGRFSN